jgi:hypothetical protein
MRAWFFVALMMSTAAGASVDMRLLAGLKARSIGPAAMSGRVAAIAADPANPNVVYVGGATGGVFKSSNSGITWKAVFDQEAVHAIGAIELDPRNPNTVWVGTGEGNVRNSASIGGGLYRSTDGGDTWRLMGLPRSERIHRIVVHPQDSRTSGWRRWARCGAPAASAASTSPATAATPGGGCSMGTTAPVPAS